MQRFLIPHDSKRRSNRPLFHAALKDPAMARSVDFDSLLDALASGCPADAADDVPIDMEHFVCS